MRMRGFTLIEGLIAFIICAIVASILFQKNSGTKTLICDGSIKLKETSGFISLDDGVYQTSTGASYTPKAGEACRIGESNSEEIQHG